jgi:TP901 family phage tail tape measure protein
VLEAGRKFLIELLGDSTSAVKEIEAASDALKMARQQASEAKTDFDLFSGGVWGTAAAIQGFTTGMVWAAANVEMEMAKAGTALEYAGTSADEMGRRFLAAGKDAATLLPVAEMAGKMGIKGAEGIEEFTSLASTYGKAMGITAEAAGSSLARIGLATGKSTENLGLLASGMVALQNKTMVSSQSLQMLILRTADVAKEAKVGEAPIMALAAAFEQKGVQARMALQPISKMVELLGEGRIPGIRLATAIGLSGEKIREWEKLSPEEKMKMFATELGKMDADVAASKLKSLGIASGRYAKQISGALRDSEKFNEMLGIASEGMKDKTALEQEAEDREKTLTVQLKSLWTSLKAVGVEIGLALIPYVKVFVGVLKFFVDILKLIPTPVLSALVVLGWFGASIILVSKFLMASFVVSTIKSIASLLIYIAATGGSTAATKLQSTATYQNAQAKMAETKATWAQFGASLKLIPVMFGVTQGVRAETIARMPLKLQIQQENYERNVLGKTTMWETIRLKANALWTGICALAKKAYAVAAVIAAAAQGAFTTALWATGAALKRVGVWLVATAVKSWALVAPVVILTIKILLVIGAVLALTYVIYGLLFGFDEANAKVRSLTKVFAGSGLEEAIRITVDVMSKFGAAIYGYVIKPIGQAVGYVAKLTGLFAGSGLEEAIAITSSRVPELRGELLSLKKTTVGVKSLTKAFAGSGLEEAIGITSARIVPLRTEFNKFAGSERSLNRLSTSTGVFSRQVGTLDKEFRNLSLVSKVFELLGKTADAVKAKLFGSSFLHIVEGIAAVMPFLTRLTKAFVKLADASQMAKMAVPEVISPPTLAGTAGAGKVAGVAAAVATARGSAGRGGARAEETVGGGGGAGGGGGEVRVVVPVTVELDGMTLARAISEQMIEINFERNMKESRHPLRGVEPA